MPPGVNAQATPQESVVMGRRSETVVAETVPETTEPEKKTDPKQPEPPEKQTSIYPIPEEEITYTGGRYRNQKFRYRLHIPDIEEGKTYPLILWLHGYGGERGDNNRGQLGHSRHMFSKGAEKSHYPFFALFPQCPLDNPGWHNGRSKDDQMATVAMSMVDQVCSEHPIDPNRIILFGISGGGTSCWRMLAENPYRFAAVVPTAAGPCETSLIESLPKDVPVWVFMYNGDRAIQPPRVRQAIKTMQERGVKVGVTEFLGTSHFSWEPAFTQMDVLDWMLFQRRGGAIWYPAAMPHWPRTKRSIVYSYFSCTWLPGMILAGILLVRIDRKRVLKRYYEHETTQEQPEQENDHEEE